jgi:predicted transcriptional regulator of viral defense system
MKRLPKVFTLAQAKELGWSKDGIYSLVREMRLERIGRGVFISPESFDPSLEPLAGATAVHPNATLCLTSALSLHGLSDAIPAVTDVALPRGIRHPAGFQHISWHSFDVGTFDIGRELISEPDIELYCYSAERTIIDCYRLAHIEGLEVADLALKQWLKQKGNTASKLLTLAEAFPQTLPRIRRTLEILL